MFEYRKIDNGGIGIHFIDSINHSDPSMIPLIISPGLSETAEEYIDFLKYMLPRRCIVLSYRGRGRSDTPQTGYNLYEHVSDLESVIRSVGITEHHIMGYSRGVSYAISYVLQNLQQVKSLIIQDYPAEHKQMPKGWSDDYINNYLEPFNRVENIRPQAVRGIQKESTEISLEKELKIPVLVLKGMLEGSLLNEDHLYRLNGIYKNINVKKYFHSGHDIRNTEKETLYKDIKYFLEYTEKVDS